MSRSITGCFAQQNIGEVPKDGGVKKTQQGERIGLQSPPPAVPRSIIPGCGGSHIREVERSDGGVEKTHQSVYIENIPLPLPCPVVLRGVSVREYRGSARRTRGLKRLYRSRNIKRQSPLISD